MKTIAEIASECGVHRTTLNKAVERGAIPARKSGSIILIDEQSEQFKQWLVGAKLGRPRKAKMREISFTDIPLAKRPETQVWQVITEQANQGQAVILQDGESYLVKFPDEEEPTPFSELAYSREIGLYDKREFPDL